MELIVKLILSYLLGSISGAMLMGKLKSIDIRKMGSGNAGGTNAFRTMGTTFAFGVLFIDVIKGFIAVKFVPSLQLGGILTVNTIDDIELLRIICGIGTVLGHVYPIYYGFKGGKGAGTLIGVVLAIFPQSVPWIFLSWLLILIFTGYVGLSTMCAGIVLVIITIVHPSQTIFSAFGYFTIGVSIFLIYTHRANIKRMIAGKENQFQKVMIFKKK